MRNSLTRLYLSFTSIRFMTHARKSKLVMPKKKTILMWNVSKTAADEVEIVIKWCVFFIIVSIFSLYASISHDESLRKISRRRNQQEEK